jgi:DNA-binding protein Fis
MFLTKEDFEESLIILEAYASISSKQGKKEKSFEAEKYAKRLFDNFNDLDKEDRLEVINMILDDIEKSDYAINN